MPKANSREINKELGLLWAKLSKKEKKRYAKEVKGDKKAVADSMKALEERMGRTLKKPVCSYSLYIKDTRQQTQMENPTFTHVQIMQR